MIKYIIQRDLFDYRESENAGQDSAINMITGRHLMEVYYWAVPVFRCNMGHSIEDDVLFCRIAYGDNTAIITQEYRDAKRISGNWLPDEVFASHAVFNFCKAFNIKHAELSKHLKGRRERDGVSSRKNYEI